jgi:hypothetical protein
VPFFEPRFSRSRRHPHVDRELRKVPRRVREDRWFSPGLPFCVCAPSTKSAYSVLRRRAKIFGHSAGARTTTPTAIPSPLPFQVPSARAGGPLVAMMRGCFCSNSVGHSSRLMRANKNPALTNRRGDKGWAKNLILHPTYMIARYLFSLPSHPCPFSSSKSRGPISGRQWIQLRPSLLPCCYLSSISPLKNRQEQPKRRSTLITYQRTGQSEVFRSRMLTVRSLPYPLLATRR